MPESVFRYFTPHALATGARERGCFTCQYFHGPVVRRSRRLAMAVGIAASLAAPEKVAAPKLYFA